MKLKVIEKVQEEEIIEEVFVSYLPYQVVLTPGKEATKIGMVFDASASKRKGGSLDENFYSGPALMPLLTEVLLRPRLQDFIIIAIRFSLSDLKKAFLQAGLHRLSWLKTSAMRAKNLQTCLMTDDGI